MMAAAVATLLFAGGFAYAAHSWLGPDSANVRSTNSQRSLSHAARLSPDERDDAVHRCVAKLEPMPTLRRTFKLSQASEARRDADKLLIVGAICDCIVNQFEDRSTLLQFKLIMTTLRNTSAVVGLNYFPDVPKLRKAAMAEGMSESTYRDELRQLGPIVKSSAVTCRKKFQGR